MEKIVVKNLYKIFGNRPNQAMELLKKGGDKQSILDKTGMTVGVDNAGFSINAGEIFVIMGLSGSGKSTIVRMLNRLIEPTAGHVIVDGKDVTRMAPDELVKFRLHNMSMVFQSFALMPHLTVLDNAAFGLELAKIDKQKRNERAVQALEQVPFRVGKRLSVGAQRRHAAACRACTRPGRGSGHPLDGRSVLRPRPADPDGDAG
jgi:glycine betaine/proline transport system ATP-binding protein